MTPSGKKRNYHLIYEDGLISEITNRNIEIPDAEIIEAEDLYVCPGGIDIHIHGGGGRDFMEGSEEAFRAAVDAHLKHGTTSIFPTLSSSSVDMIMKAARTCEKLTAEPGSPVMGLHLEGPYFNPKKAGAQMHKYITPPIKEDYEMILESTGCIKRWDSAPELPGTEEFGRCLMRHGVVAAIAHTCAEYVDVKRAFDAGYTHATHFFNAMSPAHNVGEFKHEGTIESVFAMPEMTVEMIGDGIHVPPVILKMTYLLKGVANTALITDALACSASSSEEAFDPRVIIEDGVCKLSDRSALAGSIATMDRLVKTAVLEAEIPFVDAIEMTSRTPARIMRIDDHKGSLVPGKDADIVIYDKECNLHKVIQAGRVVE